MMRRAGTPSSSVGASCGECGGSPRSRAGARAYRKQECGGRMAGALAVRTTATVRTTRPPDDEDGALLTWASRGQGLRTGCSRSMRRGRRQPDRPELYDALGILRTEECWPPRYYGVDQFFTPRHRLRLLEGIDETLEHWGRGKRAARRRACGADVPPEVVISRFHGKARDGHGNTRRPV